MSSHRAARAALEGESDSTTEAIARFAKYRLERGIFTSTGAGDLRRAILASERLVLLVGHQHPAERRDLSLLYLHAGRILEARTELETYMSYDPSSSS